MRYKDVVEKAKKEIRDRKSYENKHITYKNCETWLKGNQINLWTYWQGYQIKDVDNGVDILLVGQDWGNPDRNLSTIREIEDIQAGKDITYDATISPTDRMLSELFDCLGCNIRVKDPGLRIFFTNYSLGYRDKDQTGGMTKGLMRQDKELFESLVYAIKPKIIICLGKITYEVVTGKTTKNFVKTLQSGEPFKGVFPETTTPVYGVAHPGARGVSNIGNKDKIKDSWKIIAKDFERIMDGG